MTKEEVLNAGWTAFETGLGSTPYGADVESHWRLFFDAAVERELDWINEGVVGRIAYLTELATWMGNYATCVPSPDGWVRLSQLIKAFVAVRAHARAQNQDKPTNLCN